MAKTVKLIDSLRNQDQVPYRKLRHQVLALMPEIVEAASFGYSMKVIWNTLRQEGRFSGGYSPFCRYVNQLARATAAKEDVEEVSGQVEQSAKSPGQPRQAATPFVWPNPKSRKDLLGVR